MRSRGRTIFSPGHATTRAARPRLFSFLMAHRITRPVTVSAVIGVSVLFFGSSAQAADCETDPEDPSCISPSPSPTPTPDPTTVPDPVQTVTETVIVPGPYVVAQLDERQFWPLLFLGTVVAGLALGTFLLTAVRPFRLRG